MVMKTLRTPVMVWIIWSVVAVCAFALPKSGLPVNSAALVDSPDGIGDILDNSNIVWVESKVVQGRDSVGIYLENNVDLGTVVIPLVIRQLETYPVTLEGEYVAGARLDGHLTFIRYLRYYDHEDGICKESQTGGFGTVSGGGTVSSVVVPSPSSPDALAFVRTQGFSLWLPAGSDGVPPDGVPSLRIKFTCPSDVVSGQRFLIDTTCTNPSGHLLFTMTAGLWTPLPVDFIAGTVTCEPCHCTFQGDLDGDGFVTALDLSHNVDVLFRSGINIQDTDCPIPRADFDGDKFSTALDLGFMVDYLFAGGPGPVDPCAP